MPKNASMTGRQLLKRFSEKADHEAFATLVNRHGPMVHGVCMRILSNHHDAQDVTQAAFIILARESGKLTGNQSAGGWLHTVARRLSLNVSKARIARDAREKESMRETNNIIEGPLPEAGFRQELDTALNSLPEHYRQPLVLFHLEGSSLADVSDQLGIKPATLRSRLSRAREILRHALKSRGVEIASVGALSSLLISEAEASAFTPSLLSQTIQAVTSSGTGPSTAAMNIARQFSSIPKTSSINLLSSILIVMKNKVAITCTAVILVASAGTGVSIHRSGQHTSSTTSVTDTGKPETLRAGPDRAKLSSRDGFDPLTSISTMEEYYALIDSVFLIENEEDRLSVIRNRLGVDFKDEHYYEAINSYYFQAGPGSIFDKLLQVWLREDPEAMTSWTGRFSGEAKSTLMQLALSEWLLTDENSAMSWAKENEVSNELLKEAQTKLDIWKVKMMEDLPGSPLSHKEARAAIARMQLELNEQSHENSSSTERIEKAAQTIANTISLWAERNPQLALELYYTLDPESRSRVKGLIPFHEFTKEWARMDPDAALDWAINQENIETRKAALQKILPEWQRLHPDKIIEDVVDLSDLPDHSYKTLVSALLRDWSSRDPAKAMNYAMNIEQTGLQQEMVADVMDFWVRKSPQEAQQWALDTPPGKLRDQGLSSLSSRIVQNDFQTASNMINEIGDDQIKANAIYGLMTTGNAIETHFSEAIQLADKQVKQFKFGDLHMWGNDVRENDIAAYKEWVDELRNDGRILFNPIWSPKKQKSSATSLF